MKVIVLTGAVLLFIGCSSMENNWAAIGDKDFSELQLQQSLRACQYKEKMRYSNMGVMNSSTEYKKATYSSKDKDGNHSYTENELKHDQNQIEFRQHSLDVGQQAYQCMKQKGFVKIS